MGTARPPAPVKLIASLLGREPSLLATTRLELARRLGPIDFESELYPFDHTDYYTAEFGPGLQRQILSFASLVDPARLPAVKRETNELERDMSRGGERRVNIDPGYVSLGKLVLATTKDHAHRLYLGEGIYGEVTLTYQHGRFRAWPWTYPDYSSEGYCALFDQIRARYRLQLRQRADQTSAASEDTRNLSPSAQPTRR